MADNAVMTRRPYLPTPDIASLPHVDQLPGGLADDWSPADFDPEELDKGIKVELEHVDDRDLAQEIAMDHLVEDTEYYDKLEKVEGEASKDTALDGGGIDLSYDMGPRFSVRVSRQFGDGRQQVLMDGDACLEDVVKAAQAYQIGDPDPDADGRVCAQGPQGLVMQVSDVCGGPVDEVFRDELAHRLSASALARRAHRRRASAVLKAAMPKLAVSIDKGLVPGQRLTVGEPFQSALGFGEVPAGTTWYLEAGPWSATDDQFFGHEPMGTPYPESTAFDNARIRLMALGAEDEIGRGETLLVITPPEMQRYFELAEEVAADRPWEFASDEPQEMPGEPAPLEGVDPWWQQLMTPEMRQLRDEPVVPSSPFGLSDLPPQEGQEALLQQFEQAPTRIIGPTREESSGGSFFFPPGSTGQFEQQVMGPQAPTSTQSMRPRAGSQYEAHVAFETRYVAIPAWSASATIDTIARTAGHYGIEPMAVRQDVDGWLELGGAPIIGPHGAGRYILRVHAKNDLAKVAASLGAMYAEVRA